MHRIHKQKIVVLLLLASFITWVVPVQAQSIGLDIAGMDRSVDPGDDFFGFTNGGWYKATEIPADRTSLGIFQGIANEVNKRNAELITEAGKSNTPEGKMVGDYYTAFMDEATIESRGLEPIKTDLSAIASIKNKAQLSSMLGSQLRADVDPLNATNYYTDRIFGLWVSADFNNPKMNVPYLLQGGLGLPDREVYLGTDEESKDTQEKYRTHIANVLRLANISEPEAKAARIYDLENKIAQTHATREESANVAKSNNPWKMSDFAKAAPGLDWKSYFKSAGLSSQPMVMVWHPNAIKGTSSLVAGQGIDVWKEYLTFRILERSSGLLPKAFADESFNFNGKQLAGLRQQRPRNMRAISVTSGALSDAVGKMYTEKYFPAKAKTEIQTLVKNIIAAFRQRIDKIEWMSPETRAKAKAKVDTIYVGVGYPDKWRSYEGLKIIPNDALGNSQRVSMFNYKHHLSKLGKPVDKGEWWMAAQVVNAVNYPLQNALSFPAAILNPPFFDMNADPVANYGSIGSVIGHEISHSFDATGSLFDAEGKYQNWWTPQDLEHFQNAARMLTAQFDTYEPLPGLRVNGKLTLDENIADLAGLAAAYDGYRAAYGGKEAPTVDGLTGDQRFFIAYGQAHRGKMRPETMKFIVTNDGHAPDEYRAATVRNMDSWYKAFNVQPGKKLYLAPEARVKVW
ncbi:MAG: M13 family metallopeptidase [Chloracidobacterium sp.]|nr:M13 family metallopeptidase [Chloracidobacterium sp.]